MLPIGVYIVWDRSSALKVHSRTFLCCFAANARGISLGPFTARREKSTLC